MYKPYSSQKAPFWSFLPLSTLLLLLLAMAPGTAARMLHGSATTAADTAATMGTWQPPTQHLGAVKPTARKLHGQQGESRTPQSPPPNTTAPPPLENVACTSSAYSKQSCVFSSVCLQQVPGNKTGLIKAVLWSSNQPEHVALLQHYLNNYFQRQYTVTCQGATPTGDTNASLFEVERSPTVLWAANPANQQSLGHAMVNEAFPLFMVLQNHFGSAIPPSLQLLVNPGNWHPVLQHVLSGLITHKADLIVNKLASLPPGKNGLCFEQVVLGDGGYVGTSRASLSNSNHAHSRQYSQEPTYFSSTNWWNFRRHALKVNGVDDEKQHSDRPLILLNDKRYGPTGTLDRRLIMDSELVAANLSALYPTADVQVVRLRDLQWPEQLQLLHRAKVFITTQGSSAFRLVFLPRGAKCIMIGSPTEGSSTWQPFHELDKWFPLSYVQFLRYKVEHASEYEYEVKVERGGWQPADPEEARQWWLYNADIRLNITRLQQMLDPILLPAPTPWFLT